MRYLQTVAGHLTRVLEDFEDRIEHATLGRFGGDEFIILLRHPQARSLAIELAERCCAAFKEPISHAGLEFYSGPSIGLAVYPEDGDDVATVFKHADIAMHQAKTGSVAPVAVYTASMSSRLRDWLDLEARLRRAVEEDRLELRYQPKFRLRDQRMVGVEALLRWCDKEYGEIPPNRFIEIAEDSGLIIEMGNWVVRAACRQLRAWRDRGFFSADRNQRVRQGVAARRPGANS